jgi:hypothetical protein
MLEDPGLRARLHAFRDVPEPSVAIEDDHVLVSRRGLDTLGKDLVLDRIELALALAEAAVAESARDLPVPEGATDYRTAVRPDGRGERAQIEALAMVRASRQIVGARVALVLAQLASPGIVLFLSTRMKPGASVPTLVYLVMLGVQGITAINLLQPYLKLLRQAKRSPTNDVALVVVGVAALLLVYPMVSVLFR